MQFQENVILRHNLLVKIDSSQISIFQSTFPAKTDDFYHILTIEKLFTKPMHFSIDW